MPSVAISNFTWDWIYETHPGMTEAAPWLLPLIRDAYAQSHRWRSSCPSPAASRCFRAGIDFRSSRGTRRARARTRARTSDLPQDRPAVLLSFGGYGLPELDLATVDCLRRAGPSSRPTASRRTGRRAARRRRTSSRARSSDSGFRYEDLVAAADVVLTKPGYGIVAECMAAGTAMLYTSRGQFREYDVLVEGLQRFARSRFLPQTDLFAGRWRERSRSAACGLPPPAEHMAADGAEVAARLISAAAR